MTSPRKINGFFKALLVWLIITPIYACKSPKPTNTTKFALLDSLYFRRSYSELHLMTDEGAIKALKENPILESGDQANLIKNLVRVDFIENDRLLVSKFFENDTSIIINNNLDTLKIRQCFEADCSRFVLFVEGKNSKDKLEFQKLPGDRFRIAKADLLSNRTEEILVLKQFYFMNGESFELYVYQFHN